MNSSIIHSDHDGWVLLSDALNRHLRPTDVVHHVNGCNLSNGRNRLRPGEPEELVGKSHCLRCEAKLGLDVRVSRPSEGIKVEVRLRPDVVSRIDVIARERGQSRAAALRELITGAL
jgi:hypothetical protein